MAFPLTVQTEPALSVQLPNPPNTHTDQEIKDPAIEADHHSQSVAQREVAMMIIQIVLETPEDSRFITKTIPETRNTDPEFPTTT